MDKYMYGPYIVPYNNNKRRLLLKRNWGWVVSGNLTPELNTRPEPIPDPKLS